MIGYVSIFRIRVSIFSTSHVNRARTSHIRLPQRPHLALIVVNHEKVSVFEIRNFTMKRKLSGIIISMKYALDNDKESFRLFVHEEEKLLGF